MNDYQVIVCSGMPKNTM